MCGIDGDRGQQRVDLALIKLRGMLQLLPGHVLVVQHADAGCVERRSQRFVPAAVLAFDKGAGENVGPNRIVGRRNGFQRWLYADDAHHTSPKIRALHPESGGKLVGKPALRAWWADSFARLPGLRYVMTSITADADRALLEYVRVLPGEADMPIAEVFDIAKSVIVASRVFHG